MKRRQSKEEERWHLKDISDPVADPKKLQAYDVMAQ